MSSEQIGQKHYLHNSLTMHKVFEGTCTFRRDTLGKLTFIVLLYLDVLLTLTAMSMGLTELNTFVRLLIHNPFYLIAFKVAPPPLIAWLLPGNLLLPSIIFMGFVVAWNIKELLVFLS